MKTKVSRRSTSTPYQRTKATRCSKCGGSTLVDITEHDFPGKKKLVFECLSCGNNSMRSNVNDHERRTRLQKIHDEHLDIVECQFCHQRLSSTSEYLTHLRNDHQSNQPIKKS